MKEAFEHYFGYAEDASDILRDDYVEEYEEWERPEMIDNRKRVYKDHGSDSSSSSEVSTPAKVLVKKKRIVTRTLGREDCK